MGALTIIRRCRAILAAALVLAAGGIVSSGHAQTTAGQTIENTAIANYSTLSGPAEIRSNRVDFKVSEGRRSNVNAIGLYRIENGSGAITAPIFPTHCHGNVGIVTNLPTGAFANVELSPASLTPSDQFKAGEWIAVGVQNAFFNKDQGSIDLLEIVIENDAGDSEDIILTETGSDTAFFTGMIKTVATPPAIVPGDCHMSVSAGAISRFKVTAVANPSLTAAWDMNFLVDPFGIVFDSSNGQPVPNARVSIVDAATGQPATVYGDDGESSYPNSMVTGETVIDSGGNVYEFKTGEYRFPFLVRGDYRLIVEPPQPYSAPSIVPADRLVNFTRPDNSLPYTVVPGSYNLPFALTSPAPVRIDIPVDRGGTPVFITKDASTSVAEPGDAIAYRVAISNNDPARATGPITVRDALPDRLRLRADSVRFNGQLIAPTVTPDGRTFSIPLPGLAPGARGELRYLTEVRSDAREGEAVNTVQVEGNLGLISNIADHSVRISRNVISGRMTIIGRVIDAECYDDPRAAKGIPGVRVMLQDGSYTVTDEDGRYHFEGLRPGTHVVQVAPSSYPADRAPTLCADNTRTAGSEISRFAIGRGGSLVRADFRTKVVAPREIAETAVVKAAEDDIDGDTDALARDWIAGQSAGIEWLFPTLHHNPRSPAVSVAIKHLNGQTVRLSVNGTPVSGLNYEGKKTSADSSFSVSTWRAVSVERRTNKLTAEILDSAGAVVETLHRDVHFSFAPIRGELVRERSTLVADGITRPVIAVRMIDSDGRPVRHGVTGEYQIAAPYYPAVERDAQQARQLSGLERAKPFWRITGNDGIALIELEPTTASGTLSLGFNFREGTVTRQQQIDAWLDPGDAPWTVVGFAEGTIGYKTLADQSRDLAPGDPVDEFETDGRIALYAKGRVLGQWVMTLAYDSDKQEDETRFGGVIDPRAYYTIYADRTDTRYDAASVRKLYLKLERPQFYALFGDFETGIDEPQLARYQRSLNGVKAEYNDGNIAATAFVADTPFQFGRNEFQGEGITGPYRLSAQDILANSERVFLEVRDRLRPETVTSSRQLLRHIDYDIDYISGTVRFRAPVLSRDSAFDPQFIVIEYETDGVGQRQWNGGGRVSWTNDDESLRIGFTGIRDADQAGSTILGGLDVRYRPDVRTEIRAELAMSKRDQAVAAATPAAAQDDDGIAWLVEAEHHGQSFDVLLYARQRDGEFGVGQLTAAGNASRKFGFDGRVRIGRDLTLALAAADEDYFTTGIHRRTARILAEYGADDTTMRAGITYARDRDENGVSRTSTLATLGGSQQLFNGRVQLDAQTEFALGGQDENIDFPARHQIGARVRVNDSVALVGGFEIAEGQNIKSRTARVGFDLEPWAGARLNTAINQQNITEYGPRSFASFGLSQSLQVADGVTIDASVDANRTLSGSSFTNIVDPAQPVASGGFLGQNGLLTEDFLALTLGSTFRREDWSLTMRGEYRDGEVTDRAGITIGAIRRIGEGRALGGLFTWTSAENETGIETQATSLELSWANRPVASRWSWLNKLELRDDRVTNAIAGQPGPSGGPALVVTGNAKSQRVINSLSINYSPLDVEDGQIVEGAEFGIFWGTRFTLERFDEDDIKGWSNILGGDARVPVSDRFDIGASGTMRFGTGGRHYSWSGGPTVTWAPVKNSNIVLGYNFGGFRDRDFEESRYTRNGPYVTFRLKFDQTTFEGLGL